MRPVGHDDVYIYKSIYACVLECVSYVFYIKADPSQLNLHSSNDNRIFESEIFSVEDMKINVS